MVRAKRFWLTAFLLSGAAISRAQSVSFTEYAVPTPNSNPLGIALGPDGALWFTEGGANKIGRITPAGVITEFPLPSPSSQPTSITPRVGAGSSVPHELWFTEYLGNKIGRITTDGVITEYLLPSPSSGPNSIISIGGFGGELWFTEYLANKIGRIDPISGSITEYVLPTPGSGPSSIIVAVGELWFTEALGNKIGRITTSGAITEYAIPTANALADQITLGPNSELWFTEGGAAKIGRITRSGVITEFNIPTPQSGPVGITTGIDGALWFTENVAFGVEQIGRITTDGVITEFPIPTIGGNPHLIAQGPGSTLWFTESQGNNIGVALDIPDGPVQLITSRSDFGGNDFLDWSILGPPGTSIPPPNFSVQTDQGLTITGTRLNHTFGDWAQILADMLSFAPEDNLLEVYTDGGLDGRIMLSFSSPISGLGAQIDSFGSCDLGRFLTHLTAFNGGTALGTFTELGLGGRSTHDNSAVFIGVKDTTGVGITSAVIDIRIAIPCPAGSLLMNTLSLDWSGGASSSNSNRRLRAAAKN